MNLNPLIEKYLQDKNETRLEILLETAGKKSTKKNIEMVKLLIADEDYTSLFKFLGTTKEEKQAKKELDDFNIEEFEHNQDDLLNKVKASFGEPTEFNSLGNRILNGTVTKWTMTSAIHPDVLLRKFANQFTSNHDSWWFVTGDKKSIYDFAIHELKANIADVGADTAFPHTEHFFLLDRDRVVRGWYNGFDTLKQAKLVRDIPLLMLEKRKKRTFKEFLNELFG
jgi:hypothetical protein